MTTGSRKKTKFLSSMLCNGIDMGFQVRLDEIESPS